MKPLWTLLEGLFLAITIIANLITVFSIVANVSIFVEQHAVEIDILRSIGFTSRQVFWAYEVITFAIVASPLCLGIMCGILVSFLICKQEAMIIDIPLGFSVSLPISFIFHLALLHSILYASVSLCVF